MRRIILLCLVCVGCASVQQAPKSYCNNADVVVVRGTTKIVHKGVSIIDEQDEFVVFSERGVSRMERAPFTVICN